MIRQYRIKISYLLCCLFALNFIFIPQTALAADDDASLSGITLGGIAVSGFDPAVFTYNVDMDLSVEQVEIGASSSESAATVTGDTGLKALEAGTNVFTIICTSPDTSNQLTYTLNIARGASSDASFAEVTINETPVLDISGGSYTVSYGYAVSQVVLGATATDPNAQITGDIGTQPLVVGLNTFTITCTAEDGTTTQEFTFNLTRRRDNTLSDLTIDGATVEGFASDRENYVLTVDNSTDQIVVDATANDPAAVITGNIGVQSLDVGYNMLSIRCTVDSDMFEYVISITREGPYPDGTKLALLFGMADYPGTGSDLRGPINDMIALKAVLEHAGYTVYKYMNYSAADVLETVQAIAPTLTSGSTLLFAYSGHGLDGGYLVGADGYGISLSDLHSSLSMHPGVKEILIDACFSGDFIGRNARKPIAAPETQSQEEAFNNSVISVFSNSGSGPMLMSRSMTENGFYVITACSGSQYSYEFPFVIPDSPYAAGYLYDTEVEGETCYWLGYFNIAFHTGFGLYDNPAFSILRADDNSDSVITWDEIYQYAALNTSDKQQAQVYPEGSGHIIYDGRGGGAAELISSLYTINQAGSIIGSVDDKTTVDSFKANFTNSASLIKVYDSDGAEVTSGYVGTGMTVRLVIGGVVEDELSICIMGDVNGDGVIDINDILSIRAHIKGTYTIRNTAAIAAELMGDSTIDINDILYIRAHIRGTYDINAHN